MQHPTLQARNAPGRWFVVATLLVAAGAHLPVIRMHLDEAPYMGVLFIVLSCACVLLAATLISLDPAVVYVLTVVTTTAAVLGYAATRLVTLPMLADDVGNWLEPLGVVSVVSEVAAAAASVAILRCANPRSVTAAVPEAIDVVAVAG